MLVNCVAYRDGKRLQDLNKAQIPQFLSQPDTLIWMALADPDAKEITEVQTLFQIHPLAIEDVLHANQRPKVEEYGDLLYIVAHAFEQDAKELHRGEVHIMAGKNFVLSIRQTYKIGFTDVRERCEREPHLLKIGSGFILYSILDAIVDRYFPILESLESELENVEENIFKSHSPQGNIEKLYLLKQKLIKVHHASNSLLEALNKLYGGRVPSICGGVQDYFRDIIDHLSRIGNSVENLRELLLTAI
jgi:magnesium transporter